MSSEEIKALVQHHADAFSAGNDEAATVVFASDVVYHNPMPPPEKIHGIQGMRELFAQYRRAFPEGKETIDDVIVEGDMVAYRFTFRGTHRGEMQGIAPTNKEITFQGIVISRIAGGKMVEICEHFDTLGLLQQLGAIPPIGQSEIGK